jgi:aryl-alcohol dehydrogenase-like predicted oxidoreductase
LPNYSAVQILPRFQGDNLAKNEQLRARVEEIAASKKCSLNQLALAWVRHKGKDIVPIPGMYGRDTLH